MRVDGVAGSGMARGAQHSGFKEGNVAVGSETVSHTCERCLHGRRHHQLGSGKMAVRKGLVMGSREDR
jgi:hypothetical protein